VSWNFKHVVNLQRIQAYNSVNLCQGYPILNIRFRRTTIRRISDMRNGLEKTFPSMYFD
jgi:hypothetical protein